MERRATSHSQKITSEIRKELLPRPDKLKQMISLNLVPHSRQNRVVIPCLQKTLGFKTNQYASNKSFLEGYISKLEFNGFVRKCNKVVEEEVIKKTKKQNESFFGIISILLKISIVIAVLTFFLLSTVVFIQLGEQTQYINLTLAGVLLSWASMIAVVCPVVLYTSKYDTVNYEEAIKSRLQTLTQLQNNGLVQKGKQHLQWEVENSFFWIQLIIDPNQCDEDNPLQCGKIDEEQNSEEASGHQFFKKKNPLSNRQKDELVNDA